MMTGQTNITDTKAVSYSLRAMRNHFIGNADGPMTVYNYEFVDKDGGRGTTEGVLRALGASGNIVPIAKDQQSAMAPAEGEHGPYREYKVHFASPQERNLFIKRLNHYVKQDGEELAIVDGLFAREHEMQKAVNKVLSESDLAGVNNNPAANKVVAEFNKKHELGVTTVDGIKRLLLLEHVLPDDQKTLTPALQKELDTLIKTEIANDANKGKAQGGASRSDMEQSDPELEKLLKPFGKQQPKLFHKNYSKDQNVPDAGDNNTKDTLPPAVQEAIKKGGGLGI